MSDPRCPACKAELTFAHAMQMRNPWEYRCPDCNVALEAGASHKLVALALLPAVAAFVGGTFMLQSLHILDTLASLTFLGACAVSMLAGAVWLWSRTSFTRKISGR